VKEQDQRLLNGFTEFWREDEVMPWVKSEMCTGCGDCLEECPSGAIFLTNDTAVIDMEKCIRCGSCHEICPEEAVRHDGEKVETDVRANIERTKECMAACAKHFGDAEEAKKCLTRWIKHHNRLTTIAARTIEELESLQKTLR
jgi:NAD-dependent dihydropyrimidine dehydrogenase PreA subunit